VVAADMESTDLRMAAILRDVISVGAGVSNRERCGRTRLAEDLPSANGATFF